MSKFTHNGRYHAMSESGRLRVYTDNGDIAGTLTDRERDDVRNALIHAERAMAYAWGRQDQAGKEAKDTDASEAFAAAYGLHAYRYLLGEIGFRDNLVGAWDAWTRGLPLEHRS